MREITVAAVQMHPQLNEIEANLVRMGDFIKEICQKEPVDLIVFPSW